MVCQSCGTALENGVCFCPRCGAQVVAQAAPPPTGYTGYVPYPPVVGLPRVHRHLQTTGILWCIYGAYRVLAGLFGLFIFREMAWHRFDWNGPFGWGGMHGPPWMALMPVLVTVGVVMAGLAFVAGYSLLTRRPWGRMLTIVLAVLALFKFPVGTALGIYSLWVLAPASSAMEYDTMANPG